MKSHPSSLASADPSCVDTSRSVIRSTLLATSMTGAGPELTEGWKDMGIAEPGSVGEVVRFDSLTRKICSWKRLIRVKEAREVML